MIFAPHLFLYRIFLKTKKSEKARKQQYGDPWAWRWSHQSCASACKQGNYAQTEPEKMSACDEGCPACWPALVKRAGKKGCTRPVNKPGALFDVGQISALCKQSLPSLISRKLRREDARERSWWTNKMIGGGQCKKHFCRQQLLWGDWGGGSLWEAWEEWWTNKMIRQKVERAGVIVF